MCNSSRFVHFKSGTLHHFSFPYVEIMNKYKICPTIQMRLSSKMRQLKYDSWKMAIFNGIKIYPDSDCVFDFEIRDLSKFALLRWCDSFNLVSYLSSGTLYAIESDDSGGSFFIVPLACYIFFSLLRFLWF